MEIKSPITQSHNVKMVEKISTKLLIERYQNSLQIDVREYFKNIDELAVYECMDTGYQFYYPLDLGGDSDFYGALKNFSWYYMPWKWEHEIAHEYIKPQMNVLEIGCATGDFLKKLKNDGIVVTGLELSASAAKMGRDQGLIILEEKIEDHAKKNKEVYDVVCMFQVLEHIDNIKEVLDTSLESLKTGGKLIIAVPNNDSFIGRDKNPLLNLPPHHLGRWNTKAFTNLSRFFPMDPETMVFEPLQKYHFPYYYQVLYGDRISEKLGTLAGKVVNKILRSIFCVMVRPFAKDILGHTILAVYTKK